MIKKEINHTYKQCRCSSMLRYIILQYTLLSYPKKFSAIISRINRVSKFREGIDDWDGRGGGRGGYIPDSKSECMYNAWNIYVNGRFLEVITYFNVYYNPSGHSGAASVTYYWIIIKFKLYPHYLLRTELSKWLGPSNLQVDHLLFLCILNGLSRRTTCGGIHCGVKCNWFWNVMLLDIQIEVGY